MNTKKQFLSPVVIGVIVAVVLVIASMIAVSSEPKSSSQPKQVTSSATAYNSELQSQFRKAYMDGCVIDGATDYKTCDCTYEYMKDNLGFDKMIELGTKYNRDGIITSEMIDAANYCY